MEDLSASSGKDLLDKLRIRSKTFSGGHMSIARQKRRTSSPNIEPLTAIHAANVLADPTMSTSSSSAQQQPPLERRHTGSYRPAQRDTYILPSFQFLQMLMYPGASVVTPVPLKEGEATTRALKNLDRIPAVDFHKVNHSERKKKSHVFFNNAVYRLESSTLDQASRPSPRFSATRTDRPSTLSLSRLSASSCCSRV